MFGPLEPLWILFVGAIVGVLAGLAQTKAERTCPCCRLQVSRTMSKCPYCRCRVD